MSENKLEWVQVALVGDLADGRVKTVTPRNRSLCLAHHQGQWAAMDNRCPHQGGPLGEGSIERGVDGRRLGHVGGDGEHVGPRELLRQLAGSRGDGDLVAGGHEGLRDRKPDAAVAPGDQNDPAHVDLPRPPGTPTGACASRIGPTTSWDPGW